VPDSSPDLDELDDWIGEVCAALDLPPELVDHRPLLLDLARDAAHSVMRPAAPVTTFLVGYAAGRASRDGVDQTEVQEAAAVATALANHRGESHSR